MSDKAITQIKAELEKREKYWQEWNGRAANRIAKLEYENQELQAQVDAVRDCQTYVVELDDCEIAWLKKDDVFKAIGEDDE